MTRAEMHEKRIAKWTELIRNAENSGLTIKKWCKDNGIQEKIFSYWTGSRRILTYVFAQSAQ